MQGKTEVSVEFKPLDSSVEAESRRGDQLVEMRFFIPFTAGSAKKLETEDGSVSAEKENTGEDENAGGGAEDEEESAAQQLHDLIKIKADLGMVAGEAICTMQELPFQIPRGRYEVALYDDFLRMQGKSYDYKIPLQSIKQLFLLPKPDDIHAMLMVICGAKWV
jgi:structure-specific recognition protein 1